MRNVGVKKRPSESVRRQFDTLRVLRPKQIAYVRICLRVKVF